MRFLRRNGWAIGNHNKKKREENSRKGKKSQGKKREKNVNLVRRNF